MLPHYRCLRAATEDGQRLARYAVETDRFGVRAILRKRLDNVPYSHTLDVDREVHLFLPHVSAEEDLRSDPLASRLKRDHELYALDVRGLGETLPDDDREFFHAYGVDYMHNGYGLMLGESALGRRVLDLLSTIDLLVSEGARRVHLYGRGQGALHALFAALLHSSVTTLTLKNAPLSYHAWTQTPIVRWPHANIPRGVLRRFDLPDVIRALGKRVSLLQPWGPDMEPLRGKTLERAMLDAKLSMGLVSKK